jgi:hypothetical protein
VDSVADLMLLIKSDSAGNRTPDLLSLQPGTLTTRLQRVHKVKHEEGLGYFYRNISLQVTCVWVALSDNLTSLTSAERRLVSLVTMST